MPARRQFADADRYVEPPAAPVHPAVVAINEICKGVTKRQMVFILLPGRY
jgi:hypothetical protein